MVIDFHTHVFPEKIAEKAIASLAQRSGCVGGNYAFDGTRSALRRYMEKAHVDKAVVLNIATNPKQQKNVNNFAISLLEDECLIPFGSVHPNSPDIFEELERLKEAGIKGVKLHPDYQNFFVDEKRMLPVYEKIANLGLITVFHAGVDIGYPEPVHCTPDMLLHVLDAFGDTPVVAAHFGGYLLWKDVLKKLCGTKIYMDTAFSFGKIPPLYAKEIIETHTADKILLGSDMPWSKTEDEANLIRSLGLSSTDTEKILYKNAEVLLNLSK